MQSIFKACHWLVKICRYDAKNTRQVTRLALKLFNDLSYLHHLDKKKCFCLYCASWLYDIGLNTEGLKAHDKTSPKIILSAPILQFCNKERLIFGSIA